MSHGLGCTCPQCFGQLIGPQQLPGLFPQMFPPGLTIGGGSLSPEETKELQLLEEEHKSKLKKAKLDVFKKLPSSLRQSVIDRIMWAKEVKNIDDVTVDPDARLNELRSKHVMIKYSDMINSWRESDTPYVQLPEGLTAEELISAHTDATMEETMVKDE